MVEILNGPSLDARIWGHEECAARLNKSVAWFYSHKRRLEQLGMPKRDRELGGWDSKAFEVWLDTRSSIRVDADTEYSMLEAARGKH